MSPKRVRIICPECGYQIDRLAELEWGDKCQRLNIAPFICAGCAAAMIINLVTCELTVIPPEGWEVIRAKNPSLYAAIRKSQEQVRAARRTMERQN
jgi:hypothetical protein